MVRDKMSAAEFQLLFTVNEVASVLQVSRTKVYELIYAGSLHSVKIGSCRRVRRNDLDDFVLGLRSNF